MTIENNYPVIKIVTPCLNMAATINRTILSIISQSGDFGIRYHIQDGGSSDGTSDLIARWQRIIHDSRFPLSCRGLELTNSSGHDSGMYAAISSGYDALAVEASEWFGWLNADDILMPGTFGLLARMSADRRFSSDAWVTGSTAIFENDVPAGFGQRGVSKEIIAKGLCDGVHWNFIQQEGTFFHGSLWEAAGGNGTFSGFRYAGDWNLWRRMAMLKTPYMATWPLGVFSKRNGQISQMFRLEYNEEINRTLPHAVRRDALGTLQGKEMSCKELHFDYNSNELIVEDRSLRREYASWLRRNRKSRNVPSFKEIYYALRRSRSKRYR
ncbi:MAG: glycosyltransferase [Hyphomicrobiales bacterium]|nr:glycosyltransferase [Hyphomicrobiales bacterium]